jgi:quercetin dioxygenase-like cupin family protein
MINDQPITVVAPGEGEVWAVGAGLTCKVPGALVGDAYTILQFVLPPGGGAAPHRHTREDEILYVLDGECSVGFADSVQVAATGTTVVLPRGAPHFFQNTGAANCTLLITAVPGGLDRYFAAVAAAVARDDLGAIAEINAEYGIEFLE